MKIFVKNASLEYAAYKEPEPVFTSTQTIEEGNLTKNIGYTLSGGKNYKMVIELDKQVSFNYALSPAIDGNWCVVSCTNGHGEKVLSPSSNVKLTQCGTNAVPSFAPLVVTMKIYEL